jgi:hypothetical protein
VELELSIDGASVLTMQLNAKLVAQLLQMEPVPTNVAALAKSTPITKDQAADLLSRINGKSVHFLKTLAANDGAITWGEMRNIFGIPKVENWDWFSAGHGKGITRALRHILNDKSARLVWWNDQEWDGVPLAQQDSCKVYVDGPALDALREVSKGGAA